MGTARLTPKQLALREYIDDRIRMLKDMAVYRQCTNEEIYSLKDSATTDEAYKKARNLWKKYL